MLHLIMKNGGEKWKLSDEQNACQIDIFKSGQMIRNEQGGNKKLN